MCDIIISGVFDGTLKYGRPKGVELYVVKDISDLSFYSIGSANNGGGTDGPEFTLSGTASAGSYIYVIASKNDSEFKSFFGFTPTKVFQTGHMLINGNDAVELFKSIEGKSMVIDTYGVANKDGQGTSWDYMDGWAYRINGGGGTFCESEWSFSGPNAWDGKGVNPSDGMPIGTFTSSTSAAPYESIREWFHRSSAHLP